MTPRRHIDSRPAFSLIECAMATLIIGVMFIAAVNAAGMAAASRRDASDRAKARMIAQNLMAEILAQPWSEAAEGNTLGPASDEAATGTRSLFDDVDDYHGWTAQPPQSREGKPMDELTAGLWRESVTVEYVRLVDPATAQAGTTPVKRITITISHAGKPLARLSALRTAAADIAREAAQ